MNTRIHVLLIEDNPGDARLVKEELQQLGSPFGISLEWVDCLQKGLEYLAGNPAQAVVVDLSLPDSEGLETLRRVLACVPQTPVIVMTGLADEETGLKALQAGAQDYLIKGQVDGRLLARTLQHAIQRKQTELQLADAHEFTERIVTSSPVGIFTYRLSGECLSANAAAAQMVGGTVEQLKSQNFHQIESWKRSGLYEMARQTIDTGKPAKGDIHVVTTFGREAWYTAQFVLFRSGSEELLLLMFSDITERKQTEAALEASEKRFRAWIENSSDIITVLDRRGMIQYESPSLKRVLGYDPEELLGKNGFNFVHPEDQEGLIAAFAENIQNPNSAISAEYRFLHRDGSWRDLEGISRTYTDENGEVVGLINSRDITDRKNAEGWIREREARLKAVVENVGGILWSIDSQYRLTMFNSMYAQSIRASLNHESQLGETLPPACVPKKLQDVWKARYERALRGEVFQEEVMVESASGQRLYREYSLTPICAADGQVIGVTCLERDITDRKQAEQSLRDSETRYRTLMEKSVEAIYLYEWETRQIVTANPAFLDLLGYSLEEVRALTLHDIVNHDRTSIDSYLQQIQSEGGIDMGEGLWRRKDGTTVPVEVTANKIQQGDIDFIFVVGRDVTERKRAEMALKEKELLLSEAQRIGRIGSWSYDIARDRMTFSDEMYRLLDVLPQDFHHDSQDFLALVYPSDRAAAAQWLADIKEGTQAKDLNFRLFHKNGELCYLQCRGMLEFNDAGKPARFIGTAQDVTQRRVAEIQINQQIKRLTALGEIDRAIISSFDQRYTLGVIVSQAISQLQVDAAAVLVLDCEGDVLNYVSGQGFRTKMIEAARVPLGEVHAGRAAKEHRMIQIPDLRESTNTVPFNAFVMAEGFVSYVGVPLIVKGKVTGVLEVYQRSVLQPYQEWLDFFNVLARQTAIAIETTSLFANLEATNKELIQAYDATIEGWSRAMDLRDRETQGHTQRVTMLTLELARALGVEESRLVHIRRGALLHDIGKLGVPDHILFKPGDLTTEERAIIEKHTDFAYEMLAPIPYLKPALNIPYFHHEKWDGTGYPLGLKGEQIPLEARIFSLVDVWDALLSSRPYRQAWTREQTIEYIRDRSGTHFDPQVVDCFMEFIEKIG